MEFPNLLKLYRKNKSIYIATGYDFFEDKYILSAINTNLFGNRYHTTLNDSFEETSKEEILSLFDKELKNLEEVVLIREKIVEKSKSLKENNYIEELSNLVNKYFEIRDSIKAINSLLNMTFIKKDETQTLFYNKELNSSKKGMYRLEKRFNFFFGKEALPILNSLSRINRNDYYGSLSRKEYLLRERASFLKDYDEILKHFEKDDFRKILN